MKEEEKKEENPRTLYMKLYDLQSKLFGQKLKKHGKNTYADYEYATKEDVTEAIAVAVRESELLFIPSYHNMSITEKITPKGKSMACEILLEMKIIDPISGDSLILSYPGYAEDTGDKAVWKAYTGLFKYFWVRFFALQDHDLSIEPEDSEENNNNNKKTKNEWQQKKEIIEKIRNIIKELYPDEVPGTTENKIKDRFKVKSLDLCTIQQLTTVYDAYVNM